MREMKSCGGSTYGLLVYVCQQMCDKYQRRRGGSAVRGQSVSLSCHLVAQRASATSEQRQSTVPQTTDHSPHQRRRLPRQRARHRCVHRYPHTHDSDTDCPRTADPPLRRPVRNNYMLDDTKKHIRCACGSVPSHRRFRVRVYAAGRGSSPVEYRWYPIVSRTRPRLVVCYLTAYSIALCRQRRIVIIPYPLERACTTL